MKLIVTDTIKISSIRSSKLTAGEEVEIADIDGAALLKSHPAFFKLTGASKATPGKGRKAKA